MSTTLTRAKVKEKVVLEDPEFSVMVSQLIKEKLGHHNDAFRFQPFEVYRKVKPGMRKLLVFRHTKVLVVNDDLSCGLINCRLEDFHWKEGKAEKCKSIELKVEIPPGMIMNAKSCLILFRQQLTEKDRKWINLLKNVP